MSIGELLTYSVSVCWLAAQHFTFMQLKAEHSVYNILMKCTSMFLNDETLTKLTLLIGDTFSVTRLLYVDIIMHDLYIFHLLYLIVSYDIFT